MVVFEGLKFNSYPKLIDTEEISEGLVLNRVSFICHSHRFLLGLQSE